MFAGRISPTHMCVHPIQVRVSDRVQAWCTDSSDTHRRLEKGQTRSQRSFQPDRPPLKGVSSFQALSSRSSTSTTITLSTPAKGETSLLGDMTALDAIA